MALENVTLVFGRELDEARARHLVLENFRHLGRNAVECCRLFFGRPEVVLEQVNLEGLEHVRAALAVGRGVLFLTAHFGNWEVLAAAHSMMGFQLHVVVRPLDNPALERLVSEGRRRNGLRLIPKRRAVRAIRDALASGAGVGVLLDQDAGRQGVFAAFLGRPASTSKALAVLAARTGAPVLPAFILRLPQGGHRLTIYPPVSLRRSENRQEDIVENTARFNAAIEAVVRAHPEQWFWVHRRWKTRQA